MSAWSLLSLRHVDWLAVGLVENPMLTCRHFVHNLHRNGRDRGRKGATRRSPEHSIFALFFGIFANKGRTEMRTRDRKEWQSMRTVWDISRDDRAKSAACRQRQRDRFKGIKYYYEQIFFSPQTPPELDASSASWKHRYKQEITVIQTDFP